MASKEFKTAAVALQTRSILEEAPRGRILDRNGVVLVDNRISVIVTVDGKKLADVKRRNVNEYNALLDRLATEITRYMPFQPIDRTFLEHRMTDPRFSPYLPFPVADDVPKPLELYLAEHHDLFQDVVSVTQTTVRSYPLGRTAAHVFGYVGAI